MTLYRRRIPTVLAALAIIGGLAACGSNDNDRPAAAHPVFVCEPDELMVWVKHPHTAKCVNVEDYEHQVHVDAGHVSG